MQVANLVRADGPPLGVFRKDPEPQRDLALHRHDNVELVLVTAGTGEHRTEGGAWPLRRGDVFAIPVGMAHGYARTAGLHLVNLGYDPRRLSVPLARLAALPGYAALCVVEPRLRRHQAFAGHLHLDEAALAAVLAPLAELEAELAQRAPGWEMAAEGWLLQILVRLARGYAACSRPQAQVALRLSAVVAHIERNLDARLDQERLARIGNLSRPTLQRLFAAAYGMPVMRYVRAARLARARELLDGGLAVAEAARRTGFADPSYFARAFRRELAHAPGARRRFSRSAATATSPG
ncbi:MAG: AraC family transcriptional regulator [Planctomycetes bacterium]|nr:AraC family transcriptional regulator [Planctomycetota bacterium]